MNLEEFLIAECNLREQEEENERRDVEANKRRAKERVRERKRDAFFQLFIRTPRMDCTSRAFGTRNADGNICTHFGGCIMSNAPEKIPEKKLPTVDDMVGIYNLPMTGDQYIRQQRGDAIPDVAELQRQNAVLKTLFRKLFDEASWTVYDTIQNEACEAGAIIPHEVTQEDIDDVRFDSSECELGDTVFMMSDWMTDDAAKISIPSRAQVAREFMESVFRSHANANYKLPLAETMGIVLKEWEEADAKQAKPRQ